MKNNWNDVNWLSTLKKIHNLRVVKFKIFEQNFKISKVMYHM
jgi:hypothetical protein